jgi:hypothetical protein
MRNTPAARVTIGNSGWVASRCILDLYQIRMPHPAPAYADPCAGADRPPHRCANRGLTSGLPRVVKEPFRCQRRWRFTFSAGGGPIELLFPFFDQVSRWRAAIRYDPLIGMSSPPLRRHPSQKLPQRAGISSSNLLGNAQTVLIVMHREVHLEMGPGHVSAIRGTLP